MAKEKVSHKDPLVSPMYSSGTPDQDRHNNQGHVEGPTKGKSVANPMGYAGLKE